MLRGGGFQKVKGGDSAGQTSVVLEATIGWGIGSTAWNLSGFDFPASGGGGSTKGECHSGGGG